MSLAILLLLAACQNPTSGGTPSPGAVASGAPEAQSSEQPEAFTFDVQVDQQTVEQLVNADNLATMLASSPFYAGSLGWPGVNTVEFDLLRRQKVEEMVGLGEHLVEAARRVRSQTEMMRTAYLTYLDLCRKVDPKAEKFALETVATMVTLKSRQELAETLYSSLDTTSEDRLVSSFMQYAKVNKALEFALLSLEDLNDLVVRAAVTLELTSKSRNPKLQAAAIELEQTMQKLDSLGPDIEALNAGIENLDAGLWQLRTADFYLTSAVVTQLEDELPGVKAKWQKIPPQGRLNADDLVFIGEYLSMVESTTQAMRASLSGTDRALLMEVTQAPPPTFLPVAWADGDAVLADLQRSRAALQPGADTAAVSRRAKREPQSALRTTWNGVKNGLNLTLQVGGAGLDTLSATFRSALNVPVGLYHGNSARDIVDSWKENFAQVYSNMEKGASGSSTYRTAGDYFQGAEDAAGDFAKDKVASTSLGEGTTSWIAGQVAKATVSIFTSLGKGITALADPTSTEGELAVGALEVGFAVTGGSKVLFRGTQAPAAAAGAAAATGLFGQKATAFVAKVAVEQGNSTLNKLLLQPLTGQIHAGITATTQKAILVALEKTNKAIKSKLAGLVQKGLSSWKDSAKKTFKNSLNDYVKKQFQANMKGFVDAISTALGKSAGEYIDNVIAEMLDDRLKEMVKDAVDKLEKEENPFVGSYSGSLGGGAAGTISFTVSPTNTVGGTVGGSYKGSKFSGRFSGSIGPQGELRTSLSGSVTAGTGVYPYSGSITGRLSAGGGSGSWAAGNQYGSPSGSWSASSR
jgi:hypothetical protein